MRKKSGSQERNVVCRTLTTVNETAMAEAIRMYATKTASTLEWCRKKNHIAVIYYCQSDMLDVCESESTQRSPVGWLKMVIQLRWVAAIDRLKHGTGLLLAMYVFHRTCNTYSTIQWWSTDSHPHRTHNDDDAMNCVTIAPWYLYFKFAHRNTLVLMQFFSSIPVRVHSMFVDVVRRFCSVFFRNEKQIEQTWYVSSFYSLFWCERAHWRCTMIVIIVWTCRISVSRRGERVRSKCCKKI